MDESDTGLQLDGAVQHSTLFLKLREQSIRQISEMMEQTIDSMHKTEKAIEQITSSLSGVSSTARIWSSFYDPKLVEKLKREKQEEKASELVGSDRT